MFQTGQYDLLTTRSQEYNVTDSLDVYAETVCLQWLQPELS